MKNENFMIDFVGDIHGYADKLKQLLENLGYTPRNGGYVHPDRKVVFVGDYIDRGPQIRETLQIVKSMVEQEQAIALMGNHEYNALCFHAEKTSGGHLRPHLIKNIRQHFETIDQFKGRQQEYETYIEWFMTLPLFLETDTYRAVHACWDQANIDYLKQILVDERLTEDLLRESVRKGTRFNEAIDQTLKGKEVAMPNGQDFLDKDGHKRDKMRIKWWENPAKMTYKTLSIVPLDTLPEEPLPEEEPQSNSYYETDEPPVFFGHYWLRGQPTLYRDNICCLDYSVAKNGKLVAYRFQSEEKLQNEKLRYV